MVENQGDSVMESVFSGGTGQGCSGEGRERCCREEYLQRTEHKLIKNPIDRYLFNSSMLPGMKKNTDGSLTIYIQKDSPGKEKEANWLPAPDGLIYMVMRLYWPKTEPPSILLPGSGTWQPTAVVKVP